MRRGYDREGVPEGLSPERKAVCRKNVPRSMARITGGGRAASYEGDINLRKVLGPEQDCSLKKNDCTGSKLEKL